jgi:serine/threonine-protein kinase TTK/MPS1
MEGAGMKAARSWGIMDEDEFGESERERERGGGERGKSMERERGEKEVGKGGHGGRQGPPRPTSAPAPPLAAQPQQQQQQAGGLVPVPGRQFFVRSHPSILSYLHHQITAYKQVNKKVYVRLDMIGKGGSSRVYRVMNTSSEIYAIKRVSLDKTDADTMGGYMNEIALLKRLDGNNRIIRLVDSEVRAGPGGSKGHLLLVMECGEIGGVFFGFKICSLVN